MFSDFGLHTALERNVARLGFEEPTPVQEKAIPMALDGRDVLACAATGTGKTAAFALPILHRLMGKRFGTTRALVLTPTRELAAQVEEHARDLAVQTRLRTAAIFGGVAMGPQQRALRDGVDLLVATPGRLLDHMQYPYTRLGNVEVLVLDEADRMLDMGFLPAIRRILSALPDHRQTLFFSATMPGEIQSLARQILRDPVVIRLQSKEAPAARVTQRVYPVPAERKTGLLIELLKREDITNALVFTRTKHRANRLAQTLERHGEPSALIHGNRTQAQRTKALSGFREGRYRVLIATDVASRGIDVEGLSHVVNFDVPQASEDYIHRVGRTARAQASGDAWTLVSPAEEGELRDIERKLGQRIDRVKLDDFDYTEKPGEKLEIPLRDRLAAMRAQKRVAADRREMRNGSSHGGTARNGAGPHPRGPGNASSHGAPHAHPRGATTAYTQGAPHAQPRGAASTHPRGAASAEPRSNENAASRGRRGSRERTYFAPPPEGAPHRSRRSKRSRARA
ncbi:MAG: DEAD/DEAH box helicase [Deltaproteobacteria bacterium]|nr:DEAD/DEAH box helicase [Deltaproteobacteria bacterium]